MIYKQLTQTQKLWINKMMTEYSMTREQAIEYLFYNA